MRTVSSDIVSQLAADFNDLAKALGDRLKTAEITDDEQRAELESQKSMLLKYSCDLSEQAIAMRLRELGSTLENIKAATEKAKKAINNIRAIDKLLQIFTAATVLAAAIPKLNVERMADAAKALCDAAS